MPKNEELIKSITELVDEDKVAALDLGNKSNVELVKINKDLKAKTAPAPPGDDAKEKADADAKEKADADAKEKADAEADADKPFPYSVAKGVSITCKGARILADGDEITKKDLPDTSFNAFIKSGHIKKG